jgi:hypothetical protein
MYGWNNNFSNFNRPQTNKIVVNSLEEALGSYSDFNSNITYWDRNQNLLYDVYTDGRGQKTYDIFEVKLRTNLPKTNDDYDARLKTLEQKMEEIYGKHNAQSPDGAE